MQSDRLKETFALMDRLEAPLCQWMNRSLDRIFIARFFGRVSRMGDGVIWYVVMGLLPLLYGWSGLITSLEMIFVGAVGLVLYRRVKAATSRQRPYAIHREMRQTMLPLDRFSFPSGHTLHAVSFTWLLCNFDPALAWVFIPFAALVAMSRVILGLHYPSDVLVGALTGIVLGEATRYLF